MQEEYVNLAEISASAAGQEGTLWTLRESSELNANLVRFGAGGGVGEHVNQEVDVLIVAVAGEGVLELDGTAHPIRAGQLCVVPKGARRSIRSGGGPFAYLTCHRRRGGLWPEGAPPR